MPFETLFFSITGGILPAFVWLWFWLKEDRLHPEPKKILLEAFLAGMLMVPLVIPFQKLALPYAGFGALFLFTVWAGIEEVFKYLASWFSALRKKACDEPIDAMIYLVTTALGFAAVENTLFLLSPIADQNWSQAFLTGNFRFVGASLLHVLASALLGSMIALSFYKTKKIRFLYTLIGLILATGLHATFNLLIIEYTKYPAFFAFIGVWIGAVGLMLLFEKVKKIYPN
ncbi:MAG: hypothetical protein RJA61_320 [Candidatus Parcubacteria bacterium]|jgi:RsiW-degrading membrane proteinase PrsW (M82 family)